MNGPADPVAEAAASSVIPQPGSGPMLRRLILAIGINAAALWAAAALVDGIQLSEQLAEVFVVATIFGLVNIFIKPVIKFFAFPVILITLGLFTLVINAGMLMLADRFAQALLVADFTSAFLGGIIISVVSMVMGSILDQKGKQK